MKVTKAVIPAGGLGTRFLPITKAVPKEMMPIVDAPTIQHVIKEAVLSGAQDILIIISDGKESIRQYFSFSSKYHYIKDPSLEELNDLLSSVHLYYAKEEHLNGDGGAVLLAKDFSSGDPFSVLFGDNIFYHSKCIATKQLIDAFIEVGGKTIVGCQIKKPVDVAKYASITYDEVKGNIIKIKDIVEKPPIKTINAPCLCSVGRFVLPFSIFDALEHTPLQNGEIILTNAIRSILKTEDAYACNFQGQLYDIGDKFGYLQANVEYALRSPMADKVKAYLKELTKKL